MSVSLILVRISLVGNKNDCPEKKVVSTDDAQKFSEQIGIELHETSAKENLNVEEVCVYFRCCPCTYYIVRCFTLSLD